MQPTEPPPADLAEEPEPPSPEESAEEESVEEPPEPPKPREAVERAYRVRTARRGRRDYLRLDLAESPRPASPKVVEAIRGLTDEEIARYPDPWPLRDVIAQLHSVPTECVSITAGADEAIRWAFNAFLEPGARVVIPRPTFGAFLSAAEVAGAFVERVDHGDDLELPLDQFHKALSPRTPRMVCVANPNAPTGTALSNAELYGLAAASPASLFLINETFATFHGHSLLDDPVTEVPPNVLVLRSLSKDYGLAGMRVGYLVGAPEVIAAVDVARPSFTTSAATIAAALAAMSDQPSVEAHVACVRAALDRLHQELTSREIESHKTRCNFLLIRLAAPIQPWAAAFAAHKILVGTQGHAGPMADFIRVTVNDDSEIDRFLDVLDVILRMGVAGATSVRGVPGRWDDVDSEGMA